MRGQRSVTGTDGSTGIFLLQYNLFAPPPRWQAQKYSSVLTVQ